MKPRNDEIDDRWPPDLDDSQVVNVLDLAVVLLPVFGTTVPRTCPRFDLKPDGVINVLDVALVLPPCFRVGCAS